MAKITGQSIPSPRSVPGVQQPWSAILDQYPELTDEVNSLVAWRDTGTYDKHNGDFEKQFPSMKPDVLGEV